MADRMAFSLALLADTATATRPIAACDNGHLRVNGNTCWRPVTYDFALRTLLHELVADCDPTRPI